VNKYMPELTTSPLVKMYTLEEFWQLPEPEDRTKLELIAGVLYMTPPPEQEHDNAVRRILRILTVHIIQNNVQGNIYVPRAAIWTGPNTSLEPDLFYISAKLESTMDVKHRTTADLVIEVISPGTAIYDRNTKADTYGALGVKELWLVDDKKENLEIRYQTGNGFGQKTILKRGDTIQSKIFPGLSILIDRFFID
jgi:Uma2 family endonuclease